MTEPLRKHVFHAGRWRDHRQVPICADCGSARDASIHRVPDLTEEQREHEQRRVGERESTEDTETR